ncbi:glycoside hydrolase family 127 protein [Microlunatus parietis]|uniref:DUF1680 family protein n=1 Tax=Microlunatus parietis TaxID=682979 RepID=A0A7Y9LC56_9ACTN|nr:beta-L-arabinofuranosidase domain-containing protein [Microlunatus parietis]NYE74504.1 hypothetical protein [Microlunatus parietis]
MLTDTSASRHALMTSLPPAACSIGGDSPLARLRARAIEITIPTMGSIMFDPAISHAYQNFLIAAGAADGDRQGPPFMDGDFYKWLEAAATILAETGDPRLEKWLDLGAAAIAAAQQPDGYQHTKTTAARRTDPAVRPLAETMDFETYNFGHLINLACIHHRVTGRDDYLRLAIKVAGYLRRTCDEDPAAIARCNTCPSHYMGVIELYRTTGDDQYLALAERLLDLHGGKGTAGGDDNQDVLSVREQRKAVGHAVRANYLYAGMADVALETGDPELITALNAIWDDLVSSKLYLTGGCGALYDGASPDAGQDYSMITKTHQAYGRPYQLPQTTAYNESCASLGYLMLAWRMLLLTGEARFADEIERVIYNALPAMIGADGKSYFYTNPLRQVRGLPYPLRRAGDPGGTAVPPSDHRGRQEYMNHCFCCPPNIARFIAELPYYLYSQADNGIWVHQYLTGHATAALGGVPVTLRQQTAYPADGTVTITVTAERPVRGTIRLRLPGWAPGTTVEVDGTMIEAVENGYAVINREWDAATITVRIPLRPRMITAHHFVEEAAGQVAVVRGPVVYCLESADLPPQVGIEAVLLPRTVAWTEQPGTGIFAGHVLLTATALRRPDQVPSGSLYGELVPAEPEPLPVRLVPYGLWGNRGPGEMSVWNALSW